MQAVETKELMWHLFQHPTLLSLTLFVATRALETGQEWVFIGDWRRAGFKSRDEFRAAKEFLEKYGLCAFRPWRESNRNGTLASLTDSRIWLLN